jgi:glutaredoxin
MPHHRLAFACLALILGCDAVTATRDSATAPAAARPEGWESLEDEGQSVRLYYQFVDERRQVRFVETLDDVPEALRAGVGFVKMEVPPPLSPGDAARARAAQVEKSGARRTAVASTGGGRSDIILYSAEWCGACRKAKRYLDGQGIAYDERDVDIPANAAELVEKTGARAIPVIDVGGRILTGFNAAGYDRLIGKS